MLLTSGSQQYQSFLSWRVQVLCTLQKHSLDQRTSSRAETSVARHKCTVNALYLSQEAYLSHEGGVWFGHAH